MPGWILASAVFYVYLIAAAASVPRLTARARALAMGGSLAGLVITAGAHVTPPTPILHISGAAVDGAGMDQRSPFAAPMRGRRTVGIRSGSTRAGARATRLAGGELDSLRRSHC